MALPWDKISRSAGRNQPLLKNQPLGRSGGHYLEFCLAKIRGQKIVVHPFFLLFLFLWLLAGLPLETLFLFVLVLLHELTHSLAAWYCGIKIDKIELFPFGGTAHPDEPLEFEPRREIIIAAAGPLFNLAFFLFLYNYQHLIFSLFPFQYAHYLFLLRANLFLFVFNLLPGLPLDGGRILRALLSLRMGFFRATEACAGYGKVFGVIFFVAGILLTYYDFIILSISLLGLFLYGIAGRQQRSSIYLFLRYLVRKEGKLRKTGVLKGEQIVALESTTIIDVLKRFRPAKYHQVIVLSRTCRVIGQLSESQLLSTALEKGIHLPLCHLFHRGAGYTKRPGA